MDIKSAFICGYSKVSYFRMQHVDKLLEKYEKLRHRQYWWDIKQIKESPRARVKGGYPRKHYDKVNCKNMLLICPNGDTLRRRKDDNLIWKDLLFTDPLWIEGKEP